MSRKKNTPRQNSVASPHPLAAKLGDLFKEADPISDSELRRQERVRFAELNEKEPLDNSARGEKAAQDSPLLIRPHSGLDPLQLAAFQALSSLKKKRIETDALTLPTLNEFRYQLKVLSQKQAAAFLGCTDRIIRVWIKKGELTRLRGGKVSCSDDNWVRKLRARRPDIRLT